jgi:uncharacterized repeat protein (TIGR01451 family)
MMTAVTRLLVMALLGVIAGAGEAGAVAPLSAPGCQSQTFTATALGGAIADAIDPGGGLPHIPTTTTFSLPVSGAGLYVYDVDLETDLLHPRTEELEITLTSPASTDVIIARNRLDASGNILGPAEGADVFNGTIWDDQGTLPIADTSFTSFMTATPLEPDQALAHFVGENPNGIWHLEITDNRAGPVGTLSRWSLTLTTCTSAPPTITTTTVTGGPVTPAAKLPLGTATVTVDGVGCYLAGARLTTILLGDVGAIHLGTPTLALPMPGGAAVIVTDGSAAKENVFDGTLWDDLAVTRVSDANLVDGVPSTPLAPVTAFANLVGADPNGTWLLTLSPGYHSGIMLAGWSLALDTIACPPTDLAVTVSASPSPAVVQQPLTYALTVTNMGTAEATNVVLTDTLPANIPFFDLNASTASQGWCEQAAASMPVVCHLGRLLPADSAHVMLVVTPMTPEVGTNVASVKATQADTHGANDSVTLDTSILPCGRISDCELALQSALAAPPPDKKSAHVVRRLNHRLTRLDAVLDRAARAMGPRQHRLLARARRLVLNLRAAARTAANRGRLGIPLDPIVQVANAMIGFLPPA